MDVSEEGLRIEVTEAIALYSRVSLRADRINLAGSATVKNIARRGTKYVLGLSLSQAQSDRALAVIRETGTFRNPVSTA